MTKPHQAKPVKPNTVAKYVPQTTVQIKGNNAIKIIISTTIKNPNILI